MSRSQLISLLVAAIAGLGLVAADAPAESECRTIAGPDGVVGTADDAEVCEQAVWFHGTSTRAGNVDGTALGETATWDTTPPETSYQGGGGAGWLGNSVLDLAAPGNPSGTAVFSGTFTGEVDVAAVSLYAILPAAPATGAEHGLHASLFLDDFEVPLAEANPADVTATEAGDGIYRLDFAFTDLQEIIDVFGVEHGPGIEHTYTLKVSSFYFGDEGLYVYDAAEVPSGLVFNEDDLSGFTVIG